MNPATAYVGNYTYTLDDLASSAKKRYLMAVQSGKPVLDEELSEIGYRNFDLLRRYLEQNVGDAVIDGDRTAVLEVDPIPGRIWRVEESTVSNVNNFVVKGGTSDKPAILVVKGFPILLFSDIEYNQQDNSGSLEDDDFTNTTIPVLSPPGAGTRTDSVYVDVYLAEVSSEVGSEYQDTSLEDVSLSLQTANRFRIVQDILVAVGTTSIPADGLDANSVYHRYYKLAEIVRSTGVNEIVTADITDKRIYVNSLENLSNGKGELNVFNAFVQNDLTVHGTMTIINQTQTNQEQLVITTNDAGVNALVINKSNTGEALIVNKEDGGYAIEVNDTGTDDAIIINKTGSGYAINIQSGSMLLDNNTDIFYSPSIEGVNSLKSHIENQLILHEPTGFPNRTDTIFSFVNGTRTFTISPTGSEFSFYVNNTKFTKNSAENIVIPDVEGIHFIYYDNTGTLITSQTPWDFTVVVTIAYIHWDSTNNVAIVLAEERHGTIMDGKTHEYLHTTIGTRYASGLGLSGTTSGTGNLDADAQISLSDGTIYDEDLAVTIFNGVGSAFFEQQLSPIAYLPIFYRLGVSGNWRKLTADTFPVYNNVGTGRLGWNENAGSWQVSEVPDDYYVPIFIFATNDITDPVIAILGQSAHLTFLDAQNNSSYQALSFGAMPFQEMKVLYRLIFQTNDSYTNSVKGKLVDIQDLRSISNVPSSNYVATDHGALSGLTDQDHPAAAIFTDFSSFNGGLTATDTSVQIALDTLDDIWVRLSPSSPNTDDLYRMGNTSIGKSSVENWHSSQSALQIGGNNSIWGETAEAVSSRLRLANNIYYDGSYKRISTDEASMITLTDGQVIFYTDASGTADAIFTPSERLRITTDGRFGFATSTVTAGYLAEINGNLYVTGNSRTDGTLTQNGIATFNDSVNLSTQTADRIALIDSSKNIVSSTVTLIELQILDDFEENVQDIVGGMVSGNTESGISVTYDDPSGKLNFDVNDPVLTISGGASGSATMTNLGDTTITVTLNTENVQDIVGGMVSGNTESGISVTYDDGNGKLNFDVNDPLITLNGDVSGSATMTNLGDVTITVDISNEVIQDIVGAMVTGNTESGISVVYQDGDGTLDFNVSDFTITLTGDVSGSGTVTDLGNVSISVTVANDSHSHSNSTITSVDWSKLSNVPNPVITLAGDCSGSGTMTNLGSTTITVAVANDSHTHDTRYFTETQSDARYVLVTGGQTMSGTHTYSGVIALSGAKIVVDAVTQDIIRVEGNGTSGTFWNTTEKAYIWEWEADRRVVFDLNSMSYTFYGVMNFNGALHMGGYFIDDISNVTMSGTLSVGSTINLNGGAYQTVNLFSKSLVFETDGDDQQIHFCSGTSLGYPDWNDGAFVSIYGNTNSHAPGYLHLGSGTAGGVEIASYGGDLLLNATTNSVVSSRISVTTTGGDALNCLSTTHAGVYARTSATSLHNKGIYAIANGSATTNSAFYASVANGTSGNYALFCASGDIRLSDGTYLPFTGSHDVVISDDPINYEMGMIVITNGISYKKPGSVSDSIPCVQLANNSNDNRVFGVSSREIQSFVNEGDIEHLDWRTEFIEEGTNFNCVNSIGEGLVLVTNYNGDIANGDYITTSPILGLGMKQNDDLLHNYTVAKAVEEINWDGVTEMVEYNGIFYKKTLIACTYHCG